MCPMQLTVTPLGNNCSVETPCFLTITYNYAMYPYYGYEVEEVADDNFVYF